MSVNLDSLHHGFPSYFEARSGLHTPSGHGEETEFKKEGLDGRVEKTLVF